VRLSGIVPLALRAARSSPESRLGYSDSPLRARSMPGRRFAAPIFGVALRARDSTDFKSNGDSLNPMYILYRVFIESHRSMVLSSMIA